MVAFDLVVHNYNDNVISQCHRDFLGFRAVMGRNRYVFVGESFVLLFDWILLATEKVETN